MESEKLEEKLSPVKICIDYQAGKRQGYIFSNNRGDTFIGQDFRDLYARFLVECGFGSSRESEYPTYDLIIFNQAEDVMHETEMRLLEAVVNYHNHVVEKGKQNQGG